MTRFVSASEIDEACSLMRENGESAKFVAGGTAVVLLLGQRLLALDLLIGIRDLRDVPGWRQIEIEEGCLRIGGGVTLTEVAHSPLVREVTPSLAEAASLVGNVRVRNVATLGGALAEADYASDPPAVLVNLGASVEVSDGQISRSIPVSEFFLDYFSTALAHDEVITHVRVPVPAPGMAARYIKFSSRSTGDRPCVVVSATAMNPGRGSPSLDVVVGAIGPAPQRWSDVLAQAAGRPVDETTARQVAEGYASACQPLDDARGSEWYRREMVRVLVGRAVGALGAGGSSE